MVLKQLVNNRKFCEKFFKPFYGQNYHNVIAGYHQNYYEWKKKMQQLIIAYQKQSLSHHNRRTNCNKLSTSFNDLQLFAQSKKIPQLLQQSSHLSIKSLNSPNTRTIRWQANSSSLKNKQKVERKGKTQSIILFALITLYFGCTPRRHQSSKLCQEFCTIDLFARTYKWGE